MGRLADLTGPSPMVQAAIRTFVKAYDVNMDEAIVPPEGFESFDAFLMRKRRSSMASYSHISVVSAASKLDRKSSTKR